MKWADREDWCNDRYGEKSYGPSVCENFTETDLYDTDMEVQNLIDWICVSEQIKSNNNEIRRLTGEYKRIEPECREGVREQLERMKVLCKERNSLYEKQNDLRGKKENIERSFQRYK